ncbi:MAG: 16S rRNA (cytidine(1402)-2'-O)-methyltransferase [Fimbriimonadaceae bacterium]|nr:16S rRNA (cytidine(1402)-2'-O)-methyltransferase [Fimbriimonadaceae bacterium]
MTGRLTLLASPIGNLGDVSIRFREAVEQCELVFAEDTRVTGRLLDHLGLKRPLKTLNEHTTESGLAAYVQLIQAQSAVLITDAGTPGISDPGARFVSLCHANGLQVDAVPGPSAVTLALSLSGFFAQRFAFLGFLPRKAGPMKAELTPFVQSPYTLVLFESPFRIDALAEAALEALGDRRVAYCRELTKVHQQVVLATLSGLPSVLEMPRKGEFTVVIEGYRKGRTLEHQ